MCGLCGFITESEITLNQLDIMSKTIKHRGPDFGKSELDSFNDIVVGYSHRRLSIIDLDSRSNQPFKSTDNNIIILYNGEIYNYKQLREGVSDYDFKTSSDTEVILALYNKKGISFVNDLVGIYSIVIIDKLNQKIHLVRDRFGVKPLYYYVNKDSIVFSSELRPIMYYPNFDYKLKKSSITAMLSLGYIPGLNTVFENVYNVKPGSVLTIDKSRNINEIVYWDLLTEKNKTKKDNPPVEFYQQIISNAVERNLIASDVEVASYLSGGVDSSLISLFANEIKPVTTYTIGVPSPQFDESVYAKIISNKYGIVNINHEIHYEEIISTALKIEEIYDEPFADSSQIPTYILSKKVSEDGFKVVLSGDGGDEFYYGYNTLDNLSFRYSLYKVLNPISRLLTVMTSYTISNFISYVLWLMQDLKYFFYGIRSGYSGYYANLSSKVKLEKSYIHNVFSFLDSKTKKSIYEMSAEFDQLIYLPDDILVKLDRASMSVSLESRVPLLDHPVVIGAFRSDQSSHFNSGVKKRILKNLLKKYIDEDFVNRKKQGFSIPITEILNNTEIKKIIYSSINKEFIINQSIFEHKKITKIVKSYYEKNNTRAEDFIWNYYVFQKWYKKYINNSGI
jgi:asparagine synthase (glutamine-hydrolysing)